LQIGEIKFCIITGLQNLKTTSIVDLKGKEVLQATKEQIWALLMDPNTLAKITPGISRLELVEEDVYDAIAEIKIGPVKGSFGGKLSLIDKVQPDSFSLVVDQKSKIGNVNAKVDITLETVTAYESAISFDGKANMSGVLASKGARVMSGVANSLTKQFFTALRSEIASTEFEDKRSNIDLKPDIQQSSNNATMSHDIELIINGKAHSITVESRSVLSNVLREQLRLTGTHIGCDTSSCGTCTVLIDGKAIKSCSILAVQAEGLAVTTVEGLSENGTMHPIQEGFKEEHGLQCGFCTPGMMMTSLDLLNRNSNPNEGEIREALEGNFCRCTGYHNIVRAVQYAAEKM